MSARTLRTPAYRHHKPSGQAVVTLDGRDFYLGRHGSPESRVQYDRLIVEWLSRGRSLAPASSGGASDLTVSELIVRFIKHADSYYRKNGRPTKEPANLRLAVRPLKRLYGQTTVVEFGPQKLKAVRQAMIDDGLCRAEINRRVSKILRCFKWGVAEELLPASVHQALQALGGLRRGRAEVRESPPVRPTPDATVDAVRPHVTRRVWAMIELQRLSGMRPGEVVAMRPCDLDTSGPVWTYTPASHKMEHHGRERVIYLGPKAQAVVREWLGPISTAYLFIPRESAEERFVEQRRNRRTPMTPSQRARQRKARPKRTPGECYTVESYGRAIAKGCARAFPHPTLSAIPAKDLTDSQRAELRAWHKAHRWHPNQLRHNAATHLRREFGLDVARVILGHSSPAVTEVYAEVDRAKAVEVMASVG